MNIHELTPTEASYLLFSIKKTLREPNGITPEMQQFYNSLYNGLSKKLERCAAGGSQAEVRDKFAKVRATWDPESLDALSRDLARDYEQRRKN